MESLEATVLGVFSSTGLGFSFDTKRKGSPAVTHGQWKVAVIRTPTFAAASEGMVSALGCSQPSTSSSGRFSDAKAVIDGG